MIEPLRTTFTVARRADQVFHTWTDNFAQWWPTSHTVSGEHDAQVVFEPQLGGKIYERTAAGVVHERGEITLWDPPHRLGYVWYLRRDRANATEVEITFRRQDASTQVEIEHRGWDRLGAGGPALREANKAGWGGLLPHFIEACA